MSITPVTPAENSQGQGQNMGQFSMEICSEMGQFLMQLNMLPNQCFITAFRPQSGGVGNIAGYGHLGSGINMPGGYGVGAIAYETLAAVSNPVNDAAIYAAIANVIPAATIAWTQLQGYGSAPAPGHLDVDFILGVSVLA